MARRFSNFISMHNISIFEFSNFYQFTPISIDILDFFLSVEHQYFYEFCKNLQFLLVQSEILSISTLSVYLFYLNFISMNFISKFIFPNFISMPLSVWPIFHFLSVFCYQYTDKKSLKMVILIKKEPMSPSIGFKKIFSNHQYLRLVKKMNTNFAKALPSHNSDPAEICNAHNHARQHQALCALLFFVRFFSRY